jgi:hypothetical protein
MSKPEGIYMCVDYRVTDLATGHLIDDASLKHLTIHYPPLEGGPKVLLGFTGLAKLRDGTPTLQWIRETLRGEAEVIDQSMRHLLARLDRDIARLRVPLIINLLVLEKQRRLLGGFSNVRWTLDGKLGVTSRFTYQMMERADAFLFANGSGAARAVADGHIARLRPHLDVTPRAPMNHMKLLASVNRRVASKEATVSPFCHVSFISGVDRFEQGSQTFIARGESVPFEMPILLGGIDLTDMIRRLSEATAAWRAAPEGTALDVDAGPSDEELRRRQ